MMETIVFMYFLLNYSDKNNHLETIPIIGQNIENLFCMVSELLGSD